MASPSILSSQTKAVSGGDLLGQPVGPGLELLGAEGVVEAHHGHPVDDRGEEGRGRRPDRRGGRVGDHQLGMLVLDGTELADQVVVLGVGDLGVVEAVVALVVVGDEGPQLLGPGHRIGRRDPASVTAALGPGPAGRSPGDPRSDHQVGSVRVVEGDGLAGGDPALRRGEPHHQPSPSACHRVPAPAVRGHCTGPATADEAGCRPARSGRPSTQVTVWSVTSVA